MATLTLIGETAFSRIDDGSYGPLQTRPGVVVVKDAWEDPALTASAAGGVGAVTDVARGSRAGGCAPFDLRAGPERSQR